MLDVQLDSATVYGIVLEHYDISTMASRILITISFRYTVCFGLDIRVEAGMAIHPGLILDLITGYSCYFLGLLFRKKSKPPSIAPSPTMPTTTPIAILAPLLSPPVGLCVDVQDSPSAGPTVLFSAVAMVSMVESQFISSLEFMPRLSTCSRLGSWTL